MIRSRASLALVLVCALVAGCGRNPAQTNYSYSLRVLTAKLGARPASEPTLQDLNGAAALQARAVLETAGQPILAVQYPTVGYANLMAPYGKNGDVTTWASQQYETVALREGVVIASRGFGSDLMSAKAPGIAVISTGQGTVQRTFTYLDGGDHPLKYVYNCTFSPAAPETIRILGKDFATRKVIESCIGDAGSFENAYWFDKSQKLRQSSQMVIFGKQNFLLQYIVDE